MSAGQLSAVKGETLCKAGDLRKHVNQVLPVKRAEQVPTRPFIPSYLQATLLSILRLVPAPGISSRPSSDWFPPRVYPPVPPPIGSRPGYILPLENSELPPN
eukprot:1194097-Prorocentrum_minimum.AAC.2